MDFDPRDHEARDQERPASEDPRDVFSRDVELPRGADREIVRDRDHAYALRGSETRTLSSVGAFRVVPARRLRDHSGAPGDPRSGDLRNLRDQGLVETVRIPGHREHAVVLTKRGHELLERHRDPDQSDRQTFYAGLKRARELEHDSQIYDAYLQAAERLCEQGARIDRVALDYELKRDYQKWLHDYDADRGNYDGRPHRSDEEIRAWAMEHDLPYFDDQVHFPDCRIDYEIDARRDHEDIEVLTIHYRGAHGAAAARSGFSCYGAGSARTSGKGRAVDPRLAEGLLK